MIRTIFSLIFLLSFFTSASALPQRAVLDFDGDNKTDYVIARNVNDTNIWYLQQSTDGFRVQHWGQPSDRFVPADYDGDGKCDFAVWRAEDAPGFPAYFYILQSTNGALRVVPFGRAGDKPYITQDFDGDGKTDPAVTRVVDNTLIWYIQRSLLGFTAVLFGVGGTDSGIRGDYDADGKADLAVYRYPHGSPASTFIVLRSSDGGVQTQTFGNISTDVIFPADFDGDGKTDYTVWRTDGIWYWINSSDNSFHSLAFGYGIVDQPVPGDYDGDGKTDQAVWRPISPQTFYVNRSMLGFTALHFGTTDDVAVGFYSQAH